MRFRQVAPAERVPRVTFHKDFTAQFIRFIQIMDVPCRYNRFIKLFPDFDDVRDDLFQCLFTSDNFTVEQPSVERLRKYFQIIIKFCDIFCVIIRLLHHCSKYFPLVARTADQYAFSVFLKDVLTYSRHFVEVVRQ